MTDSARAAAMNLLHQESTPPEPEPSKKHPEVLELSGNSETMLRYQKKFYQKGLYRYLKLNVMGTGVHSFNYCVFYAFLITGILFIFPLFLLCSHAFKMKLFKLVGVKVEAYEAMAEIMAAVDPEECYIVVEDNFFDEVKAHILTQALNRTNVRKVQLANLASRINTKGKNCYQFDNYMSQLGNPTRDAESHWG